MEKLKFGKGNSKLDKSIYTFSLPAGHSCPFAYECKASADRNTGKITDGDHQTFRCFAASAEATYPTVRKQRWHNYDLLKSKKTVEDMVDLIQESMPKKAEKIRIHVSGDFFNQSYFDAWIKVANLNPNVVFYAYTKSVRYWVNRISSIPDNMKLTSSVGGKDDSIIDQEGLKKALVVYSEEQANSMGLEIDHDDSHAYGDSGSFALLLHGTQAAGSDAAKALSSLKKMGITGYSKKNKVK